MNKRKLIFNILGLVVTTAYYTATLVIESRRKTKISDEDKNDIADKVVDKLLDYKGLDINSLYGEYFKND